MPKGQRSPSNGMASPLCRQGHRLTHRRARLEQIIGSRWGCTVMRFVARPVATLSRGMWRRLGFLPMTQSADGRSADMFDEASIDYPPPEDEVSRMK
jgi:hypothetical protein